MRNVLTGMAVLLVAVAATNVYADCTCDVSKVKNGWCGDHSFGYYDSVQIKSKKLYTALAGQEFKADEKSKCYGCKTAMTKNGRCPDCGTGFVDKKAYNSKVAYLLANGVQKDVSKIYCESCKKAAKAGAGWCGSCNVGMVGNVLHKSKESFETAKQARTILVSAAKSKCETCAVAMVTDGTCESCKLTFKDGEKQKG